MFNLALGLYCVLTFLGSTTGLNSGCSAGKFSFPRALSG